MRTNPSVTKRKKDSFFASFENGNNVSVREAARIAKISTPTAYSWLKQRRETARTNTPDTISIDKTGTIVETVESRIRFYETKIKELRQALTILKTL